jgi:hypothetical protein
MTAHKLNGNALLDYKRTFPKHEISNAGFAGMEVSVVGKFL